MKIKKTLEKLILRICKFKIVIVATIVTSITFIFVDNLRNFFQGEVAFSKTFKSPDYILLDCYESVEAKKQVGVVNPNVIIIQDDEDTEFDSLHLSFRLKLASLIQTIDSLEPAAIGIDHGFYDYQPDDSLLINAINQCKTPIVLASNLSFDTEYQKYTTVRKSIFADSLKNVSWGLTNLDQPSASPQGIIRNAYKFYTSEDGLDLNSFSIELIERSGLLSENTKTLPFSSFIYYRKLDTVKINWKDLLLKDDDIYFIEEIKDVIRNKIVLIGNIQDRGDLHMNPSENFISGVEIHAASIYTFLNNKYMGRTPTWVNNLIALLCVFLFTILLYYATLRLGRFGNLFIRITQTFLIILFIIIGYFFYNLDNNSIYIDFSSSILMIGISSFVFDIVRGLYGIILFLLKKHN